MAAAIAQRPPLMNSETKSSLKSPPSTGGSIGRPLLPLSLAATAGQESEKKPEEASQGMEERVALIEGARAEAVPVRLPPRERVEEAQPAPLGAAPKRQNGTAQQGLICGDA